ncbi:MAG: uroporphyrinogen-III synthase [Flavobacteriaceae bacterium]|nr:MAG: uroporphyrinogen-III synthase [Flavobacteriaceae bacterium]
MKVKSILISQPEPSGENSPYFDIAKKHKVVVDFRPFIHVEGATAREVRSQKIDFSKFTAVIFTSRNAVDHYFRLCEEMRFPVLDAMKYFCKSEAIANYLQKYIVYRKKKVFVGQKSFEDLIPCLLKYKNEKFFLPTADISTDDDSDILDQNNLTWSKGVLFKTVCSDLSDLDDVTYDILVFFSPSGIKSLFENFPGFKQNNTRIAVFGQSTLEAVIEHGLEAQIQVPSAEYPSMTTALDKYITQANKGK